MAKATTAYTAKLKKQVRETLAKVGPDLVHVNYKVPKNLSATELRECPPEGIDPQEWVDACRFVTGTIIDHQDQYVQYNNHDELGVAIHSKVLRDVLSNSYPLLRNHMEKKGLIKLVKDYSNGRGNDHSKIYILGDKYIDTGYKTVVIKHNAIRKRIVKWQTKQRKRLCEIFYVIKWLFDGGLEIDKQAATRALEELESMLLTNARKIKSKEKQAKIIRNINRRYDYSRRLINDWEKKVPQLVKMDKAGRLYTVLASIPSVVRNFITYRGENLVALDIKNSQPVHSVWLLRPEFWSQKQSTPHDLSLEILNADLYKKVTGGGSTSGALGGQKMEELFIILQKIKQNAENQQVNEFTFEEVVRSGKLYEFIANRFSQKYKGRDGKGFSDREKAKKAMMVIYYDNNAKTSAGKDCPYNYFKKLFPDITFAMELLKQNQYKNFPELLQKLEARMILHEVCREIYEKHTEIPLFTIHDSILTTRNYLQIVESIIQKKYKKLLGFNIKLKPSKLDPSEYFNQLPGYIDQKLEIETDIVSELFTKKPKSKTKELLRLKKLSEKDPSVPFPGIDEKIRQILLDGYEKNSLPKEPPFHFQAGPWE